MKAIQMLKIQQNCPLDSASMRCPPEKTVGVKPSLGRFKQVWALMVSAAMLGGIASTAQAQTPMERVMLNSQHILNTLHGVNPNNFENLLSKVAGRQINRLAPELPVFIVEIVKGKVLLYEGQADLKGADAQSVLVDDTGSSFGKRAVDLGKSSRSGWLQLALGGQKYQTYCSTQYPFVVCSLLAG